MVAKLELADGESGAAAVSVVVRKKKTEAAAAMLAAAAADPAEPAAAADPAEPAAAADSADAAELASQDKSALKSNTKLLHEYDSGLRKCQEEINKLKEITTGLMGEETKLKDRGVSESCLGELYETLKKSRQAMRKLIEDKTSLVVQRKAFCKEHGIALDDGEKKQNSNVNGIANVYDKDQIQTQLDDQSTSGTERKDANAVPASDSACFCGPLSTEITLGILTKERCPYCSVKKMASTEEKEHPIHQLAYAQKQEDVVSPSGTERNKINADDAVRASESEGFCASLSKEKSPYCSVKKMSSTEEILLEVWEGNEHLIPQQEQVDVVSASEAERKEVNADVAVPPAESAGFSASLNTDLELHLHKIRLEETVLEKERLAQQLLFAEKQLNKVKAENSELIERNKRLQNLHDNFSVESGITSKKLLHKLSYCHDIFLCPNEVGAKQLEDYLSDSDLKLICRIMIPGATTGDPNWNFYELEKMTPSCKIIFLGMIDKMYGLHRVGLSLGGKFSLKDFFWTLGQKVRLGASTKKFVSKRTKKKMKLDYWRLYEVMVEMLEEYEKIPADLDCMLDLMKSSNVVKYQTLIRYNFCLMDDILKREYTITLFTEMEKLDREDYDKLGRSYEKYRTASALKFIIVPEDWAADMCSNKFVKKIYDGMMLDRGNHWMTSTKNLVKFTRHCLVHLPDHAFDEYKETHFDDTHVVDMVQVHAPLVFCQFQKGMHSIKKLAFPHLIRVMKA